MTVKITSDVPFIYEDKEPNPNDGRQYPDYKEEGVRTINVRRTADIQDWSGAEWWLYERYRYSRIVDKKMTQNNQCFTFKVIGHDT